MTLGYCMVTPSLKNTVYIGVYNRPHEHAAAYTTPNLCDAAELLPQDWLTRRMKFLLYMLQL